MSEMFNYQEIKGHPSNPPPSFNSVWDREKYYLFNPTPFMMWMYTRFPYYAVIWLLFVFVVCKNIQV